MSPKPLNQLIEASAGLPDCDAWRSLSRLAGDAGALRLGDLLDAPDRYGAFHCRGAGLTLDFSRQVMTADTLAALVELAAARDLGDWIAHLFAGAPVNNTEQRPALHMALRRRSDEPLIVDGEDLMPGVRAELSRVLAFAEAVRGGEHRGHSGKRITDVVNIGIGGSDLGLVMVDAALARFRGDGPRSHYVSNIDGSRLADLLEELDPDTTLFIICSKSFTTQETQLNAEAARRWFVARCAETAIGRHFAAVSVNAEAMDRFGIDPQLRFRIWDWVGGRYSLWSAVGLAVAIAIGTKNFSALLTGAAMMDEHFRSAPCAENLPALLGLIGIWNQNFLGCTSHAVLPYDERLHRLPAFLQQLEMESNGKSVTRDGAPVGCSTGTVIWGEPGSNAQHSFFQLLHQGTARVSMDFVAPVRASGPAHDQHLAGLANMLAQAEAFARGYSLEQARAALVSAGRPADEVERLAPHKTHPGNRPSSIVLLDELTPENLGALIALYEHKVFVQSVIWGINPFDQWGVELGKTMAGVMHRGLTTSNDNCGLPPAADEIRRDPAARG